MFESVSEPRTSPEMELLVEAAHMRSIVQSLKKISQESDGVMVNGQVLPWDEVLPDIESYPDFNVTENSKELWMDMASGMWEEEFQKRIKKHTINCIASKGNLEDENVYFQLLMTSAIEMINKILDKTNHERFFKEDYPMYNNLQDLLLQMVSVVNGAVATSAVRDKLFRAGMYNVHMEFLRRYRQADNEGRETDREICWDVLQIIHDLNENITIIKPS